MPATTAPNRATWCLASVVSFLLGLTAVGGVLEAPPAEAYWTDSGTITSGTFTTWGLSDVLCPAPVPGNNHVLTWAAPTGSTSTVTLTASPAPGSLGALLATWTTPAPRAGTPLTTTGTQASWGIARNSGMTPYFSGSWTLQAAAPGGVWTATRTGTWSITYSSIIPGSRPLSTTCTVDP